MYIFLFLLIEISYEKSLKGIFDETQLKNLKLKNRIFKG